MAFGQLEFADRPLMGAKTEGGACRRFKPLHVVVPVHQNAWMSRPDGGEPQAVGSECQAQEGCEDSLRRALSEQDPLELVHALISAESGEGERAPADAQCHAEGGLVGPVSGNVTDHDVYSPVRRLHDVVEISAQQGICAARPVSGDDVDAGVVEQERRGLQATLEPGILARPDSAGLQFDGGQLGPLALDRVKQRAPEGFGFHPAFDEVVLRAGGHRGYPEVLVVQPGQHHDRNAGIALADPLESTDPAGVGQIQVQ